MNHQEIEIVATRCIEPTLREHPFIRGLTPKHMQALDDCAANRDIRRGEYLWRQGDSAETFYLLHEGEVALGMTLPTEGLLRLETLRAGDVVGWSWILAPYRWHFDAYALTAVRAVGLSATCLREKCARDPQLYFQLLVRLVPVIDQRLQATRRKLLNLYAK